MISGASRLVRTSCGKSARSQLSHNCHWKGFSTKIQPTQEELQKGLEKIEGHRKFIRKSSAPKSLTAVLGTGADLHVPENISEMAALSGMPEEQAKRTVLIGQRVNKSQQSGDAFAHQWQIVWKNQERWSNPLMGWTSTADPMSNVKLYFDSKAEAVAFAERNGWTYELLKETSKSNRPPGFTHYKHNFLSKRTAAMVARDGHSCTVFDNPGYGSSHFFMPLKYHGDGEVDQHGPKKQAQQQK